MYNTCAAIDLSAGNAGRRRLLKQCVLKKMVYAIDIKLNTPLTAARTADHGAGFHLLARYACHVASNALWICLACWAGIGAAVNGGTNKKAKWRRHIQDSIPGSLHGVDFWSLQTAAAAADATRHSTREFAKVTHDPPDRRL